jgi:pantoate--beta-alanine ligase
MIVVHDIADLRTRVDAWRRGGNLAFVPTMGNLHAGHLSLMGIGRREADRVVASIFVNPMQFAAGEDLDSYPRTFEEDVGLLEGEGVDLLFAPEVGTMYPRPPQAQTRVEVPGLSGLLCGRSRPGHFVGVATVVCKLFGMVQPDIAVFGRKDFQQLLVIRRIVEDLAMPVRILGAETLREADGLAMSSRNAYLTNDERARASGLYRTLRRVERRLRDGDDDYATLEAEATRDLEGIGFRTDYLAIRRADDLALPAPGEKDLVVLAAAFLGRARLIDNIEVGR